MSTKTPATEESAKVEETADAAAPAEEASDVAAAGGPTLGGLSLGQAAGLLAFVAVSLATFTLVPRLDLTQADQKEAERIEEERAPAPPPPIEASFTAKELLEAAEGALAEGRSVEARRLLDEARRRLDAEDVPLRIQIFQGLAKAAELEGRSAVADIHRRYISRLEIELGPSMAIFYEAERLFRADDLPAARKRYSRFILRAAELKEPGRPYVARARERIATIMERRFRAVVDAPARFPIHPEEFFLP